MTSSLPISISRRDSITALALAALWTAVYVWRALVGHYSLSTNAFDLSVFDYALWSLQEGGRGFVPFMGHSIFSHHFMPILFVLTPLHAVFGSPVFLLVLQRLATAGAALMFYRFQRGLGLEHRLALPLMLVFLLARRTHSAIAGFFYPECFQAILTFALVAAWNARAWLYWPCVLFLLMTKEDASMYVGAFAGLQLVRSPGRRRRMLLTAALAAAWITFALLVAIPASRRADGLASANPLLESRFGSSEQHFDAGLLSRRLLSPTAAQRVVNLLAMSGFLPLAGGAWIVPALPGMAVNMAAAPETMQAALMDHYAWPILPWVFMSTAAGALWLHGRSRRFAVFWVVLLLAATAIDNPAVRRLHETRLNPDAGQVLRQLRGLQGTVVLAQPNLIPHLPRTANLLAVGGTLKPGAEPDLVLLTEVGNLWPLRPDEVVALIEAYGRDERYQRVTTGPLHAFKRR